MDYSREAIILNISVKGAIIRGRRLIEEQLYLGYALQVSNI